MPIAKLKKPEMLNVLSEAIEILNLDALKPFFDAVKEMNSKSDVLDIAVLGRFKAGKSSVLNSILGGSFLPVGALPVTAVITRISYGKSDEAFVSFLNGSRREIGPEQIADFITEEQNSNNEKQAEFVDVATPKLERFKNLRFIDTPGLGSLFLHNTEATKSWLPNLAAAIVCLPPDPPLSLDELALLKEVVAITPEVQILITKADIVSDSELSEIERFLRQHTQGFFHGEIFIHSIKPGFENLRENGIENYLHHLSNSVDEVHEKIISAKVKQLMGSTLSYIGLAEAAQKASEKTRADLVIKTEIAIKKLNNTKNEFGVISREFETRGRKPLLEVLSGQTDWLRTLVDTDMKAILDLPKTSIGHMTETYERELSLSLAENLYLISDQNKNQLLAAYRDSCRTLRERAEFWQLSLSQAAKETFGIELERPPIPAEPENVDEPDIQISVSVEAPIFILWSLFPFLTTRTRIQRCFQKQIASEIEKNTSRLTTQWHERLKGTLNAYSKELLEHLHGSGKTILSLCEDPSESRQKAIAQFKEKLNSNFEKENR